MPGDRRFTQEHNPVDWEAAFAAESPSLYNRQQDRAAQKKALRLEELQAKLKADGKLTSKEWQEYYTIAGEPEFVQKIQAAGKRLQEQYRDPLNYMAIGGISKVGGKAAPGMFSRAWQWLKRGKPSAVADRFAAEAGAAGKTAAGKVAQQEVEAALKTGAGTPPSTPPPPGVGSKILEEGWGAAKKIGKVAIPFYMAKTALESFPGLWQSGKDSISVAAGGKPADKVFEEQKQNDMMAMQSAQTNAYITALERRTDEERADRMKAEQMQILAQVIGAQSAQRQATLDRAFQLQQTQLQSNADSMRSLSQILMGY